MAYPLGAFKLSCRSITFTKPSSLPVFNIMLPWEEDLDEALKTFLLRQACGPLSIFPKPPDTFMFHGWVMYRHLKEQKLALFTSLGKRGISERRVGSFQGYQADGPD